MRADLDRWNRKYRGQREAALPDVDEVLTELVTSGAGLALDLACGRGANAVYLAEIGYTVVGIDGSSEALRQARTRLAAQPVNFVVADLDRYPLPAAVFDLVVVVKYLNRPLLGAIGAAVKPGGLLFYRTFNRGHLQRAPRFNPDYVLKPGELEHHFAGFEFVDSHDQPESAPLSHVLCRRPA